MIDLGDYRPESALGPVRLDNGVTQLGRATTTEEQRRDAIEWMMDGARADSTNSDEFKATIQWSRGEPTVLVVRVRIEQLPDSPSGLYLADRVEERSTSGAEIMWSKAQRAARLNAEVQDLADKGLLS